MDGKLLTERLLAYARAHLHMQECDVDYMRNVLLSRLKTDSPYDGEADVSGIAEMDVPDALFAELKEYAFEAGLADEESAERFCADIFGILTPLPSVINADFERIRKSEGAQAACDDLYALCVKNGYIQKTAISRNLKWDYQDGKNRLEITVNLSKPEKSNKDIAKLLTAPQGKKYPKCQLCKENEGFEGTASHPARRNLRTVKVTLGGEKWFVQYSPYAYYDEHCIAINEAHVPMNVNESTPVKLLDFVDVFPNYFIGSNASLPIVGGSILNHEHFQGGVCEDVSERGISGSYGRHPRLVQQRDPFRRQRQEVRRRVRRKSDLRVARFFLPRMRYTLPHGGNAAQRGISDRA